MASSTKRTWTAIIVIALAAAIIGVIFWSANVRAPETSLAPSASSSPASGTGVSVSSTGGLSVSISTSTASTSASPTSTAWQPYTSKTVQISFSYPSGWSLGPDVPISIDNFNHQYQGDSIIPMGGAEIDIMNTNLYGTSLPGIIATETSGDTVSASSSVAVDGVLCTEIFYGASYAAGYPSSNIGVYCPDSSNGLLYKIYLSYRSGDPKGAQYLATFSTMLNSMRFTN